MPPSVCITGPNGLRVVLKPAQTIGPHIRFYAEITITYDKDLRDLPEQMKLGFSLAVDEYTKRMLGPIDERS